MTALRCRCAAFSLLLLASCGRAPLPADYLGSSGEGESSGSETSTSQTDPDPTGAPVPTPPDPPGTGEECFEVPEQCLTFVACIEALIPSQAELIAEQFGDGGSCWCADETAAQDCFEICIEQLEIAVEAAPTESACHESACELEQLDPTQPYGPVVEGTCADGSAALEFPLGLPGSVCAPSCAGGCPNHTQTAAEGTCYINESSCALRCWVDPRVVGGNQCQCGARCQPHGAVDGDGNLRGICTFE